MPSTAASPLFSSQSAALAWASASTSVTARPASAAMAARYTQVVVLPTPPFRAATTSFMRGP
jgi:hypothetical protein